MSTTELSVPSPRRALSRLRRTKASANHSTNSLISSSSANNDTSNEGDGHRASVDHNLDQTRSSTDERRGSADSTSHGRRLSNIFSRKKRQKAKQDILQADYDQSQRQMSSSGELDLHQSHSDVSLVDESGNSSLLTDDYNEDEGDPTRPSVSRHSSHLGYLTLSSPLITAQPQPEGLHKNHTEHPTSDQPSGAARVEIPRIVGPDKAVLTSLDNTLGFDPSPTDNPRFAFTSNGNESAGDVANFKSDESTAARAGRSGAVTPEIGTDALQGRGVTGSQPPNHTAQAWSKAPSAASVSQDSLQRYDTQRETSPKPPQGRVLPPLLVRPETPQNRPESPQTPQTFVTPPTPTEHNQSTFSRLGDRSSSPSKGAVQFSPSDSPRRSRALSGGRSSKLSRSTVPPLTPTVEEAKTPGGTIVQPSNASGFFSSVFSVAQKAADQLSHSINVPGTGPSIDSAKDKDREGANTASAVNVGAASTDSASRPAVETIGKGDLNLSHVGIYSSQNPSPMSSTISLPQQQDVLKSRSPAIKTEEEAAARAVSMAYEKPVSTAVSQATGGRPTSIASNDRLTLSGDQSPPRLGADADGPKRAGSVRSKLSGKARRHRGSSAATGGAIATALKESATGLAQPSVGGQGHRLTGFAVASKRRNKDFHQQFRSVPEDDYLIEDYSAALQRDILLHGRLYVSEGHICFSSNILGWVTNLVMSFDDLVAVEKKSTAVIFPNAIVIQTLHGRNTFASFVARDSTYELIIGIWKINHPSLKSSLNGVALENEGTGDKTEKAESVASDDASEDDSEDEVYDEDAEDDGDGSFTDADANRSVAGSDIGDHTLSRKTSGVPVGAPPTTNGVTAKATEAIDPTTAAAAGTTPSGALGPQTHAPTECSDSAEHYDRPLTDTTIPAPIGKIYSLMFGPASGAFMRKWLAEDQKCRELDMVDDKIGLDNDHKNMTFSYIKPLNAPVGPKQTKCITQNSLEAFNLEKAVTVNCSTQTPDVPSGNVFMVKTKYCLMWGPNNSTRLIVNCTIEWTGKSWLKGPIEKGATDGQVQYIKDLVAALKTAVSVAKPSAKSTTTKKGKRKGKSAGQDDAEATQEKIAAVVAENKTNWGILEPLRGPLDPILALVRPFITSQVIIAVLFVLLAYTWVLPPSRSAVNVGLHGYSAPERIAAYEGLWQQQEGELWDWLDDRIGLDNVYASKLEGVKERQKALAFKEMGKRLDSERMNQRQIDEAIKVTEERLLALKKAVEKTKAKQKPKAPTDSKA